MDESVLAAIERTKGKRSTSECVNELLKLALEQEQEQRQALEQEAARFYSVANQSDRTEERAFQQASLRRMRRE
jgi:phospholipase/lecithinase/hemolysin